MQITFYCHLYMNENLKKDFRFIMKQRGGRMAKGRLLGIQFDALFTDDLYFRISSPPFTLLLFLRVLRINWIFFLPCS